MSPSQGFEVLCLLSLGLQALEVFLHRDGELFARERPDEIVFWTEDARLLIRHLLCLGYEEKWYAACLGRLPYSSEKLNSVKLGAFKVADDEVRLVFLCGLERVLFVCCMKHLVAVSQESLRDGGDRKEVVVNNENFLSIRRAPV